MSSGLSQGNAFAFVRKDVTVSNSAGRLLDGVLVYFGYPQAREDDAERAVRAGLELIAAVSDLKTHAPRLGALRLCVAAFDQHRLRPPLCFKSR
jgi:class 3 adenylate cyclase